MENKTTTPSVSVFTQKAKLIAEKLLISSLDLLIAAANSLDEQYNTIEPGVSIVKQEVRKLLLAQILDNFIHVAGGEFTMGDGSNSDNKPVQAVVAGFDIGRFTITEAQWMIFGEIDLTTVCSRKAKVGVSWFDCVEWCKKLSEETGFHVSLPTEKQWEYAARGGRKSKGYIYSGSNNPEEVAWINPDSAPDVGTKKPNELDIYDMSGGVWEWCHNGYKKDYDQPRRKKMFATRKAKFASNKARIKEMRRV